MLITTWTYILAESGLHSEMVSRWILLELRQNVDLISHSTVFWMCVCVLLVRMFDIHQVLWCRFYVNSKLHIWKTNWWNVNLSPSIFFLSSYLHNGKKYFIKEDFHFHAKMYVFKIYPIKIYQHANKGWGVSSSVIRNWLGCCLKMKNLKEVFKYSEME